MPSVVFSPFVCVAFVGVVNGEKRKGSPQRDRSARTSQSGPDKRRWKCLTQGGIAAGGREIVGSAFLHYRNERLNN